MPLRFPVLARKSHKWLGLFVGLQVVVWSLSGLYMTAVHIDTIHGDHLIRQQRPSGVDAAALQDPLAMVARTGAVGVRMAWIGDRPVYVLASRSGDLVVDAHSGQHITPPTEAHIRALASAIYTGNEPIALAELITDIPREIRGRKPPLWRVEFDHWNKPTL